MVTQVAISKERIALLDIEQLLLERIRLTSDRIWVETANLTRIGNDPELLLNAAHLNYLMNLSNVFRRSLSNIRRKMTTLDATPEIYFAYNYPSYNQRLLK